MKFFPISLTALILAAGALLGLSQPLPAETLTLEEALSLAEENSLSARGAEKALQQAQRQYRRAGHVFYPQVTATGALSRSNEITEVSAMIPLQQSEVMPGTGIYDQYMVVEDELSPWALSAGIQGQIALTPALVDGIQLARLNKQQAQMDQEKTLKALERDVKKSFYQILYLKASLELLEDQQETSRAQFEQTRLDYENGRVSELVLLNTEVAYKNMEPSLSALRSQYRNSLGRFALLIGLDPSQEIVLEGSIELPQALNAASLQGVPPLDEGDVFDLRSLSLSEEMLKQNRRLSFSQNFLPLLSVSASWLPAVSDPFNGETWEDSWTEPWSDRGSLSVTLTLPLDGLLPGSAARTELAEMQEDLDYLRQQIVYSRQNLEFERLRLIGTLQDSLTNMESLELARNRAERNLALTREGYRQGTQDFLSLQNAETEEKTAKINLLEEKLSFLSALFDLEYLLNKGVIE